MGESAMKELTERQRDVYDYLSKYHADHGYMPTIREVTEHFGWKSANAAHDHLLRLWAKGWVRRTPRGYYPVS